MKDPIPIEQSKDGKFFFRVKAENGKTLAHSETYTTKQSAQKGKRALIRAAILSWEAVTSES
jgi:uncharacterized protein YegP (UPF0339 family)